MGSMEAGAQASPSRPSDTPIAPFLNVMILYEDFGTGLRAKRSLDLLPEQLRANAKLSTKLWRIELLADPLLSEQAAMEAGAADVIILSVHGQRSLSAEVQAWLSSWLRHRRREACALGVLLDSRQDSTGSEKPIVSYLQQVANVAGADLFYSFSDAPGTDLDPAMEKINQRARQSSTVLEEMLSRSAPRRFLGH